MNAKSICLVAAVLFLCTASPSAVCAAAETADSGGSWPMVAAFNRADFKEALQLARPLARKGDAEAEHILGLMYSSGFGVDQDFSQAAAWYEKPPPKASRLPRTISAAYTSKLANGNFPALNQR